MTKHLTHFIKHNYHPELRHTGIGPPTLVIPAAAGIHCNLYIQISVSLFPSAQGVTRRPGAAHRAEGSHSHPRHTGIGPPTLVIPAAAGIHCNLYIQISVSLFPSAHGGYPQAGGGTQGGGVSILPPSYRRRPVSIVFFSHPLMSSRGLPCRTKF